MILRSVRLCGWKCFVSSVEIDDLDERLNVLYASNGTGKSTLLGALSSAFFDSTRRKGQEVEALRPWGRTLAPTVELVFEDGCGILYRLRKRFLENPQSKLDRFEKGAFAPFQEGEKAEKWVRNLFKGASKGKGLVSQEEWGLARILWAPQKGISVAAPEEAAVLLREKLGSQISDDAGRAIEDRVEKLYGGFFTPKGSLKKVEGEPEIVKLQEAYRKQEEEVEILSKKVAAFEEASRKSEELRLERENLERIEEELQAQLDEEEKRVEEYKKTLNEVALFSERAKRLKEQFEKLEKQIKALSDARQSLIDKAEEKQRFEMELLEKRKRLEEAEEEERRAQESLTNLEQEARLLRWAASFLEAHFQVEAAEADLKNLKELEGEKVGLKQRLEALKAPTEEDLDTLRQIDLDLALLKGRREASLLSLEITAEKPLGIHVLEAEQPGTFPLNSGETQIFRGSSIVCVHIEGVGTITTRGPMASLKELDQSIDELERKRKRLLEAYGTASTEELANRRKKASQIEEDLRVNAKKWESFLKKRDPSKLQEALQEALEKLERLRAENEKGFIPPEEWKADPGILNKRKGDVDEALRKAQEIFQRVKEGKAALVNECALLGLQIDTEKKELDSLHREIANITADGLSDEERSQKRTETALLWRSEEAQFEQTQKKLEEMGEDPTPKVASLKKELQELKKKKEDIVVALTQKRTLLSSEEGGYSRLCEAEERLAFLKSRIEEERTRINGIRLLHDVLEASRAELLNDLSGPVADRATELLKEIWKDRGERFKKVSLCDKTFAPQSLILKEGSEDLSILLQSLSGGEEEQVHLAVRLALAELLAGSTRQPLVLDDALAYTDDERMSRICALLRAASEKLQILVLTCDPRRFAELAEPRPLV